MGDRTGISWTDATWNPIRGCSRVSGGCRHCYAERVAARFGAAGQPYEGLTSAGRWNGKVRLIPEKLDQPLRWKRPRRIFVNSMSDLFHEHLADDDIDQVIAVMALAPQHVFQVLTKRAERMEDYIHEMYAGRLYEIETQARRLTNSELGAAIGQIAAELSNVQLGVSAEDQPTLDERTPHLLATPAAVRFLSLEPLLTPVDVDAYVWPGCILTREQHEEHCDGGFFCEERALDWIIVGGESGPGARRCDPDWIDRIVEQCRAAGVPCFVKQTGSVLAREMGLRSHAGADPSEWPAGRWPQELPA